MSTSSTYLRLEVISGVAPGSTLIVEDELVIGRHATGAGRLAEDEEISRQHARISREATGSYAIEDLGSSNGTFVNGLRIQTPRLLEPGDSIETGATTLLVREVVRPTPAEAAPESAGSEILHARTVVGQSTVGEPLGKAPSEIPPLALKLEVDFVAREARIGLGEGDETVCMVFADGAWRARTTGTDGAPWGGT